MMHRYPPVSDVCDRCGATRRDVIDCERSIFCDGPLTHEERLILIYRPFMITYYGRSYPWGGVLTGGHSMNEADCGGHRASTKTNYSEEGDGGVGFVGDRERSTGLQMHDAAWFAAQGDEITKFTNEETNA